MSTIGLKRAVKSLSRGAAEVFGGDADDYVKEIHNEIRGDQRLSAEELMNITVALMHESRLSEKHMRRRYGIKFKPTFRQHG